MRAVAAWMGVSPAQLASSLREYDAAAACSKANGTKDAFGKTIFNNAPFTAGDPAKAECVV